MLTASSPWTGSFEHIQPSFSLTVHSSTPSNHLRNVVQSSLSFLPCVLSLSTGTCRLADLIYHRTFIISFYYQGVISPALGAKGLLARNGGTENGAAHAAHAVVNGGGSNNDNAAAAAAGNLTSDANTSSNVTADAGASNVTADAVSGGNVTADDAGASNVTVNAVSGNATADDTSASNVTADAASASNTTASNATANAGGAKKGKDVSSTLPQPLRRHSAPLIRVILFRKARKKERARKRMRRVRRTLLLRPRVVLRERRL